MCFQSVETCDTDPTYLFTFALCAKLSLLGQINSHMKTKRSIKSLGKLLVSVIQGQSRKASDSMCHDGLNCRILKVAGRRRQCLETKQPHHGRHSNLLKMLNVHN